MADAEFRIDLAGVREALHMPGVQAALMAKADEVAAACNADMERRTPERVPRHGDSHGQGGYVTHMDQGKFTSIAVVATGGVRAMRDEARHRTLESHNH